MQKFCMKCGALLNENGKCSKCGISNADYLSQSQSKAQKKETPQKHVHKKAVVITVISLLLVAGIVFGVLFLTGVFGKKKKDTDELKRPDAKTYLKDYGTILEEIPVGETESIYSEAQAYEKLTKLGFDGDVITAAYDMEGKLLKDTAVSPEGTAKHPYYSLSYYSDKDIIWSITFINGSIIAQPMPKEINEGYKVIFYSDNSVLTFYDSKYNSFFEIKPDSSNYVLRQLDRINAEILDGIE